MPLEAPPGALSHFLLAGCLWFSTSSLLLWLWLLLAFALPLLLLLPLNSYSTGPLPLCVVIAPFFLAFISSWWFWSIRRRYNDQKNWSPPTRLRLLLRKPRLMPLQGRGKATAAVKKVATTTRLEESAAAAALTVVARRLCYNADSTPMKGGSSSR